MYLMNLKKEERERLNLAKQRYLQTHPEKSKVSDADVINAALDFYNKEGGKSGRSIKRN